VIRNTHVYNWFLAFDPYFELCLPDINNDVFAFQVSRYLNADIEVADCLGPFVGKSSLLCSFFGPCSLVRSLFFYKILSQILCI
jgi:hypothetical protein